MKWLQWLRSSDPGNANLWLATRRLVSVTRELTLANSEPQIDIDTEKDVLINCSPFALTEVIISIESRS